MQYLARHKSIRVGTAVSTLGFGLYTKSIIHSVVPKWKGGKNGEYEKLRSAYLSTLELAGKAMGDAIKQFLPKNQDEKE